MRGWFVAGAALAALAIGVRGAGADEPGPGGLRPIAPRTGAEVYQVYCQVCHMAGGEGAAGAGAFPALARNARLATSAYPIYMIARGKGAMPSFEELSDEQLAELVSYLRTHFGNAYPEPVTAAEVHALRESLKP